MREVSQTLTGPASLTGRGRADASIADVAAVAARAAVVSFIPLPHPSRRGRLLHMPIAPAIAAIASAKAAPSEWQHDRAEAVLVGSNPARRGPAGYDYTVFYLPLLLMSLT